MPVPETFAAAHIRLRRPRLSDADAIFEYGSDPEVARYADWPRLTTIEPLVASLHARRERWESGAEYYWVITPDDADRAIGGVSCRIDGHSAEIGFLVNRQFWGRGVATAAAGAVVDWLLTLPSIWRVWATCDTANVASTRVLEKVGMTREGTLRRWAIRPNLSPTIPRDAHLYARICDRVRDHA